MQYFSNKSIKPTLKYHPDWYYNKILEKCHVFYDNENPLYRTTVHNIANDILTNKIVNISVKLYNDDNTLFNSYEIINPFQNIPHLNIISKLKIFINPNNDKESYILASNLDKELIKQYNPGVLPLYKSNGTTIQVISIIIETTDLSVDNLYNILIHEIKHGLDYIKDSKLT